MSSSNFELLQHISEETNFILTATNGKNAHEAVQTRSSPCPHDGFSF